MKLAIVKGGFKDGFVFDVSGYNALLARGFINEVLEGSPYDFGYFRIGPDMDCPKYEYENGKLKDSIPKKLLDMRIHKVTAFGGSRFMSYLIIPVKEKDGEQESKVSVEEQGV